MADLGKIMYNPNPNPDQIFWVGGSEKVLIPPTGAGGISQANIINGLVQCGAVDIRGSASITAQVNALEIIPWHPDSLDAIAAALAGLPPIQPDPNQYPHYVPADD